MRRKFKRENFGNYIVISNMENTKQIAIFRDGTGKVRATKIKAVIKQEFSNERKYNYSENYKYRRYSDKLHIDDYTFDRLASSNQKLLEDEIIERESVRNIIREIWNLPSPQNRRVYMNLINEISLTEIARIEKCSVVAIRKSIELGKKKLREKLEKIKKN